MKPGLAGKNAILGGKLDGTIYIWIFVKKIFLPNDRPYFFSQGRVTANKQFFKSSLINIVNIINIFNIIKVTLSTFFDFTYFNSHFQTKETCKRCQSIFWEQEMRWTLLGQFWKILIKIKQLKIVKPISLAPKN